MSRKTIISIVVLMGVALIGLVGFQLYWINNVIKLNNERFVNNVHESLNRVVSRLEKRENVFFVSRGVSRIIFESDDAIPNQDSLQNLELFIHADSAVDVGFTEKQLWAIKSKINGDSNARFKIREELESQEEAPGGTVTKRGMIEVILQEMTSPPRFIGHRISKDVLDTMLHQEFANKGIHLQFEYGVLNPTSKKVILANTSNIDHLLQTDLRATLFPNDIISNANYLSVNFPDKGSFLFKQIWATLASSLVLLIVIVGCFAFAVLTIIRQKKLSVMKNDFINNMTHEFKTPIATVSLACQALGEDLVLNQPNIFKKYLEIIKDENERLESQVERVLQLASMEKEDLELSFEKVDLIEVINAAIDQISIQVEERGGKIHFEKSSSELWIKGDVNHLFSVFLNLLDNANKYSPKDPIISVKATKEENNAIVEISDEGTGMSKEVIRKIFDKFYRVPTGNIHNVKGFGLGLHYVRSIIESHGGKITVKSELGQGSTFKIEL